MISGYPSDGQKAMELILTLDDDELQKFLWQYPTTIQEMFRVISERYDEFFDDPAIAKTSFALYNPSPRKLWRGLWIGHLPANTRLQIVSTLAAGGDNLSQETLNFLTLTDTPAAKYQMIKAYDPPPDSLDKDEYQQATLDEYQIGQESRDLAAAFVKQMVAEAEPQRRQIILGHFVMERTPLSYLDSLIDYDTLRLVTSPAGIFGSLVKATNYLTFFWAPEITTTWSLGAKPAWAINTMLACIWRDACIIKHKMMSERQRGAIRRAAKKTTRNPRLILPRIIHHCAWGSDAERERLTRSAHSVRAFYRQLPSDQQASDSAIVTANEYGYPEPPPGFTFVQPHTRGDHSPEATPATPIICLGLRVANLALDIL